MLPDLIELAFSDDSDIPAPDAADHLLVRWLRQRLGRPPSWMEVLALRAALRERARRRVRWAWWRRLRPPVPSRREDLVADFLRSWEGQVLFQFLGGMAELVAQLALPNPWDGFDGRHPSAQRLCRRDALLERVALGCAISVREQAAAVLAYAEWKVSGVPVMANGFIPEAAEFLTPVQAAAINAMTGAAVMGVCARLGRANGGEAARRAVLRELDRVGAEALRLWPHTCRRVSGPPQGLWPLPDDNVFPAATHSSLSTPQAAFKS